MILGSRRYRCIFNIASKIWGQNSATVFHKQASRVIVACLCAKASLGSVQWIGVDFKSPAPMTNFHKRIKNKRLILSLLISTSGEALKLHSMISTISSYFRAALFWKFLIRVPVNKRRKLLLCQQHAARLCIVSWTKQSLSKPMTLTSSI